MKEVVGLLACGVDVYDNYIMPSDFVIRLQNPHSDPAQAMLDALWDEIQRRYEFTAPTDMHPDDFTNPRAAFWVAMVQDTPAGSIGLMPLPQDIAELNAMYVTPEFRGAGIAQGLIQAREEHARQHDFTVVPLRAGSQQPEAVRFYEKMGFNRIPCFGKYAESSNSWCFEKQL